MKTFACIHHNFFNIHSHQTLIKGMNGIRYNNQLLTTLPFCDLSISHIDASIFEKILFSHHQAAVYPWEYWSEFLVIGCTS